MNNQTHPMIIQGGMGVGISHWGLAHAVSVAGQLGVVSGTAIDTVFVRRLQDGDPGGHMRAAMTAFPWPDAVAHAMKYFRPDGRAPAEPYALLSMYRQMVSRTRISLTVLAAFTEVWLARRGHDGPIGINLLAKVQLPNLATLYGAMLAGVDYVLMGAGIPKDIPGALDRLAEHQAAVLRLDVEDAARDVNEFVHFDPAVFWTETPPALKRPFFFPIVAATSLATMLARKSNGRVDGFIVEGFRAGGHNAPPRGATPGLDDVIYGERDIPDLEGIRALGLPFWLAGGTGSPTALSAALEQGANGIQVGTLFAYAEESGMNEALRRDVLARVGAGTVHVRTDGRASPTGYPFKVVELDNTLSSGVVYQQRQRQCDLGYLRVAYRDERGRIGYRCAAEPVTAFIGKGGNIEQTVGRRCLCNALLANIGLGQSRGPATEPPLITSGDDLMHMQAFLGVRSSYTVADVLAFLTSCSQHSHTPNSTIATAW